MSRQLYASRNVAKFTVTETSNIRIEISKVIENPDFSIFLVLNNCGASIFSICPFYNRL